VTAIYLKIDPQPGTPTEGGPFSAVTVSVSGSVVATGSSSGWYINDGSAFGDANLTGTTQSIVWGQAK